jgi:hypothetical protein
MTTMRIPGFSAEGSFYRSGSSFTSGRASGLQGEEGVIHPALPIEFRCNNVGAPFWAYCCLIWASGQYCWINTHKL